MFKAFMEWAEDIYWRYYSVKSILGGFMLLSALGIYQRPYTSLTGLFYVYSEGLIHPHYLMFAFLGCGVFMIFSPPGFREMLVSCSALIASILLTLWLLWDKNVMVNNALTWQLAILALAYANYKDWLYWARKGLHDFRP